MSGRLLTLTFAALAFALVCSGLAALPARAQELPVEPAQIATPAPSQTGDNQGQGDSSGPMDFLPNPREWASDVFNQVLVNLLQGISGALRFLVGGVMGSSLNFITQTPPAGSYASPTVR